jgi:sulfoxide reductase catalytic subunit YedY
MSDLKSEITPEATFLNRRFFIKSSLYAGTALTTAGLFKAFAPSKQMANDNAALAVGAEDFSYPKPGADEPANSFTEIASYNDFYEFSTSKSEVAQAAWSTTG